MSVMTIGSGWQALRMGAIVLAICACSPSATPRNRSKPASREIVITTIPLLTKEMAKIYPFLATDFAKGGVLEGKEVYAFEPSTITVFAGDTLNFVFINPEDDPHNFVMNDFAVSLPPQAVTRATYVTKRTGIFEFRCAIVAHLPMMHGQLIVLGRPEA